MHRTLTTKAGSRLLQSRLLPWLGGAAAVALVVLIDVPLCGFKALFGLPCPGCGMTRALSALLGGDIVSAFRFHPLVFVLLPTVAMLAFAQVILKRSPSHAFLAASVLIFGLLSAALWVARLGGALGGHPDLSQPLF